MKAFVGLLTPSSANLETDFCFMLACTAIGNITESWFHCPFPLPSKGNG